MYRLFKTLTLGLIILLLMSCEHGGDYSYVVDNKSNEVLKLYFKVYDYKYEPHDTIINIESESDYRFYNWRTVNHGSSDLDSNFLHIFDVFDLKPINDSLTIIKDFRKRSEWSYSTDGEKWGPENEYRLIIEQKDIDY